MPATVTRLQPRVGSFPEALAAFRAARLRACLGLLYGLESTTAAILRARTLLRLGDPEAARRTLEGRTSLECPNRGEIAMLRAVAHDRLGDRKSSDDAFRDAFVYSVSALDVALEAEVDFFRGLASFRMGALEEAQAACTRGLATANSAKAAGRAGSSVPLSHVVSRLQELLGIVATAQGRYRDSLVYARTALNTLDACSTPDLYQHAFALRNLAIVACEFDVVADAAAVANRVSSFEWTEDISRVQFAALDVLGWSSALHGDIVGALRLFRRAGEIASTEPERIYIAVNRSIVARELGHEAMALEEVECALRISDQYDWRKAPGDYQVALLILAQAAATLTPARARQTFDRYTGTRDGIDAQFVARFEPRLKAEEAFTQGLILRAEGRLPASTERFRASFDIWQQIGFEWRAARAAVELAELDGGEVYRLAVRREICTRPDSIFAERARLVA